MMGGFGCGVIFRILEVARKTSKKRCARLLGARGKSVEYWRCAIFFVLYCICTWCATQVACDVQKREEPQRFENVSRRFLGEVGAAKATGNEHLRYAAFENLLYKDVTVLSKSEHLYYALRSPWDNVVMWIWELWPFKSGGRQGHRGESLPGPQAETSFAPKGGWSGLTARSTWQLNDINLFNISQDLGYLRGFGDLRSRKHTDMFFVSKAPSGGWQVTALLWNSPKRNFQERVEVPLPEFVGEVDALVPLDVNLDGALDVAVIFRAVANTWSSSLASTFDVLVLVQDPASSALRLFWDSISNVTLWKKKPRVAAADFEGRELAGEKLGEPEEVWRAAVHPFVVDVNFDGYPDFVTQSTEDHGGLFGKKFVWINKEGRGFYPQWLGDGALRQFWKFSSPDSHEFSGGDGKPLLNAAANEFSTPHSSAFVDINGDCKADVIFDVTDPSGVRKLEVWLAHSEDEIKRSESKAEAGFDQNGKTPFSSNSWPAFVYSPKHDLVLPAGAQQVSFSDINGDGTIDVVFPQCGGASGHGACTAVSDQDRVGFAVNVQPPLCLKSGRSLKRFRMCRQISQLCEAERFSWRLGSSPLNPALPDGTFAGPRSFLASPQYPLTLRVGDFDSDGFPDVLTIVRSPKGFPEILMLRNTPISPQPAFNFVNDTVNETNILMPVFLPHRALQGPPNLTSLDAAVFFDLGEDGFLDVVAVGTSDKRWWGIGEEPKRHLISFIQKAWEEPFFLKLSGLNGVPCKRQGRCANYGSACYGGTFKISGVDLDGNKFSRAAPLLPQTAYSPLQLPYTLFGLGHVNNYIDYFFYGVPLYRPSVVEVSGDLPVQGIQNSSDKASSSSGITTMPAIHRTSVTSAHHPYVQRSGFGPYLAVIISHFMKLDSPKVFPWYHRWTSLIPNSFVIVNPWPRDNSQNWQLELSVSPSKKFWRIFTAVVISLIAIGCAILVLDRKEKAEDLKEHQGFKRHFIAAI